MSKQFSLAVRNAVLNAVEQAIGTSPVIRIYTGPAPSDCASASSGVLLASISLPSDWLADAGSGVKTLVGSWQANAGADGAAGHYRLWNTGATVCHEQGSITATGNGGDMTLDNINLATGQQVMVTAYTLAAGNA